MSTTPNTQAPLFLFVGPPHHGKTTARKIFCDLTGIRGASTSDVIYALLAQHKGITEAELRAFDKEDIRKELIEFGDFLCGSIGKLEIIKTEKPVRADLYRAPSALVRALFHGGFRALDGVRRKLELQEVRERMEWLGIPTVVTWIERPDQPVIADNTQLTKEDADQVIINDGSPSDLKVKIKAWVDQITKKPEGS